MSFWEQKRVVVTGGSGFIGSHVAEALKQEGCRELLVPRRHDYDLTRETDCARLLQDTRPDIVVHMAGLVGGILANKSRPAEFFYQNVTMDTFMLHYSWSFGVQKFVAAGAGIGYPQQAPVPLKEESLWDGLPQSETVPFSLAKRLLCVQSNAYYQQYGFESVVAILGSVYGPNDKFDSESAPVVPALVRKFVEAVERDCETVTLFGTGKATRDFIYVEDVAQALLLLAEKCRGSGAINISSGKEVSIAQLVGFLKELTGFRGQVVWDASRPEGALRRCLDVTRARELGFVARTDLREGLERTIAWYDKDKVRVGGTR